MQDQIKTALFLGMLSVLLIGVSSLFGTLGLYIGITIALILNVTSYFFSDRMVLAIHRAKHIQQQDNPRLYALVKHVATKAHIPMPRIYIIHSTSPNAFATGRNPKNSSVAFTDGLLRILTDEELTGVIAHEIAHIRNRDILIATVASTIAAIISYIAILARWSAIFGSNNRDNLLVILIMSIITPIIAMLIQLAISRSREFVADRTAAIITRQPNALASALDKITGTIRHNPLQSANQSTASLFIANPFHTTWFSTHPPTHKRIERLKTMRL